MTEQTKQSESEIFEITKDSIGTLFGINFKIHSLGVIIDATGSEDNTMWPNDLSDVLSNLGKIIQDLTKNIDEILSELEK